MHALGQFIQSLMDGNGWKQADLARKSGLSTAVVSRLLTRDHLGRMVEDQTLNGLARAFPEVGRQAFITKGVEAMGIPVEQLATVVVDLGRVSDDALLQEIRRRMNGGASAGDTDEKISLAGDGSTEDSGSSAEVKQFPRQPDLTDERRVAYRPPPEPGPEDD